MVSTHRVERETATTYFCFQLSKAPPSQLATSMLALSPFDARTAFWIGRTTSVRVTIYSQTTRLSINQKSRFSLEYSISSYKPALSISRVVQFVELTEN